MGDSGVEKQVTEKRRDQAYQIDELLQAIAGERSVVDYVPACLLPCDVSKERCLRSVETAPSSPAVRTQYLGAVTTRALGRHDRRGLGLP
jgi:hypothetical protein